MKTKAKARKRDGKRRRRYETPSIVEDQVLDRQLLYTCAVKAGDFDCEMSGTST